MKPLADTLEIQTFIIMKIMSQVIQNLQCNTLPTDQSWELARTFPNLIEEREWLKPFTISFESWVIGSNHRATFPMGAKVFGERTKVERLMMIPNGEA